MQIFKWAPCFLFFSFSTYFQTAFSTEIEAQAANKSTQLIQSSLQTSFPELIVQEGDIVSSPIPGLYQVTASGAVLYVTQNGRYLVSGDIIDLQDKQNNLTEHARKKVRLAGLSAMGQENMIVFAASKPKHTITVFTDIDCGYCRKLQEDMPALNAKGITVRYLAFPRSGPQSSTFEKMVKVWCAKDRKKALEEASHDKAIGTGEPCDTTIVAKSFDLGLMLGVAGTPTMILEDGTLYPGYLPPDKLLSLLQSNAGK